MQALLVVPKLARFELQVQPRYQVSVVPLTARAPSPQPSSQPAGTAVIEQERVVEPAEPGDHERFAHYVRKADIVRANVTGKPVVALCGKRWVPNRDPSRFPICPTCAEIKASLTR